MANQLAALDRMIKEVGARRKCVIPSPKNLDTTARIMGYVEGYVVMRHTGCMPFIMASKDVLKHLQACRHRRDDIESIIRTIRARIGGAQ